eukprot:2365991-Prymnesium_polylepis.2
MVRTQQLGSVRVPGTYATAKNRPRTEIVHVKPYECVSAVGFGSPGSFGCPLSAVPVRSAETPLPGDFTERLLIESIGEQAARAAGRARLVLRWEKPRRRSKTRCSFTRCFRRPPSPSGSSAQCQGSSGLLEGLPGARQGEALPLHGRGVPRDA